MVDLEEEVLDLDHIMVVEEEVDILEVMVVKYIIMIQVMDLEEEVHHIILDMIKLIHLEVIMNLVKYK